jgi:hypothetical protein
VLAPLEIAHSQADDDDDDDDDDDADDDDNDSAAAVFWAILSLLTMSCRRTGAAASMVLAFFELDESKWEAVLSISYPRGVRLSTSAAPTIRPIKSGLSSKALLAHSTIWAVMLWGSQGAGIVEVDIPNYPRGAFFPRPSSSSSSSTRTSPPSLLGLLRRWRGGGRRD